MTPLDGSLDDLQQPASHRATGPGSPTPAKPG